MSNDLVRRHEFALVLLSFGVATDVASHRNIVTPEILEAIRSGSTLEEQIGAYTIYMRRTESAD